jgi:hypothetical protein
MQPVDEEAAPFERLGVHLDVVDAHVQVGARNLDHLDPEPAAELPFDALPFRAHAQRARDAVEHQARAAGRADEPPGADDDERHHDRDAPRKPQRPAATAARGLGNRRIAMRFGVHVRRPR